jgi:hypothetical protein
MEVNQALAVVMEGPLPWLEEVVSIQIEIEGDGLKLRNRGLGVPDAHQEPTRVDIRLKVNWYFYRGFSNHSK